MLVSEWDVETPPEGAMCRLWKYDTGTSCDAYARRSHLEACGLWPFGEDRLASQPVRVRVADGTVAELPIRLARLWLVSNIPHLSDTPLRISLAEGIPFVDAPPSPTPAGESSPYPLVGIRAFKRAGLSVCIDHAALTLSVWTPGSWVRHACRLVRRVPTRFRRVPLDEFRQNRW
jgi:hypothetical protein